MKIDSSFKVGIVSSIIGSCIFLIFLEPILHGISGILFGFGAGIFHAYTDRLFAQAALLTPPYSSFEVYIFVIAAMVGVAIGYTAARIAFWRSFTTAKPRLDRFSRLRRFPRYLLVFDALAILALVMLSYSHLFQLRVISSFRQHMLAVAPYISDAQTKQLYSEWTQMRNEADYLRIYNELSHVAQQNNIRLPENIVFSLRQL
jgi:hypothetical protein